MKNKIPYLTVIALAALAMAGCQRQTASPPADQQTSGATNSTQAGAPMAPEPGNNNTSAAANPANTNTPASTNQ